MFYGIMENEGKRVRYSDAFSYACEKVENGTQEEKEEFMKIAKAATSFDEFNDDLVEWFYSGNWIRGF